jgi:hypothetical protein
LREHLPQQFLVDSGFLISPSGYFSSQADLVIVDHLRNAALHAARPERLWPVESAYALFEVKSLLSPTAIADAIKKCRRFKTLERQFLEFPGSPRIRQSLFVLWAFESPAPATVKANLLAALGGVPRTEQPDFFIVPDRFVVRGGDYLELSLLGQPGSVHRTLLQEKNGSESRLLEDQLEMDELGENALMAWYVWFDSWLRHAGPRLCDPVKYLPPDKVWGQKA